MRLNRVEQLKSLAETPEGRVYCRGISEARRWFHKHGMIEYPAGYTWRITPKGLKDLEKAVAEHARHGRKT